LEFDAQGKIHHDGQPGGSALCSEPVTKSVSVNSAARHAIVTY